MVCDAAVSLSWFRMQLSDDPHDWVWCRTYWCQPGAEMLPYWEAYGNPVTDTDNGRDYEGPGFQYRGTRVKRVRYLGTDPRAAIERPTMYARSRVSPYPGKHPIGRPEWFADGIPADDRVITGQSEHCSVESWYSDIAVSVDLGSDHRYGVLIAAGGQREGGTSFEGRGLAWVAAGGQREGGTTSAGGGVEWTAAGGQAEGGVAVESSSYEWTAGGGQREGGVALSATGYPWTAAGGEREGGIATQGGSYVWTAAGGQAEGGIAAAAGPYVQAVSGGQREGGSTQQTGVDFVAAGGQAEGGTAVAGGGINPPPLSYFMNAEGGQSEGGTIQEYLPYAWTAAGGEREGGAAAQFGAYALVAAGGQSEGGTALQWGGFSLVGTGGQVEGGIAYQGSDNIMEFRIGGTLVGTRPTFNLNPVLNGRVGMADNPGQSRVDLFLKVPGEIMADVPYVGTQQSTTSTSYVDLATVQSVTFTLDVDTEVYVFASCAYTNNSTAGLAAVAINVDGVNTLVVQNAPAAANVVIGLAGMVKLTLLAGTRTVKMRYLVASGTGFFSGRSMLVLRGP